MNSRNPSSILKKLLDITGGYYILITVSLAQFATYIFTIPVSFLIAVSAEFTLQDFKQLWFVTLAGMLISLGILLGIVYLFARQAFLQLENHKKGISSGTDEEKNTRAWKQISSLPWFYARIATLLSLSVAYLPMILYEIFAIRLSFDQVIYTIIGVILSSLGIVTLGMNALEGMISPARQILLPKNYQAQITGSVSLKLLPKLNIIILTLITISILLVAPIGYHFTSLALRSPNNPDLLRNYQAQSLGFSFIAIFMGAGLAWMLSQSVSVPLSQLVAVFQKVEQGDLDQSAPVVSSDETGELTIYFNRMLERVASLQGGLQEQVTRRTAQLSAVNEVGQAASAILNRDELIARVVNLITDKFGHYYAAIFLLDNTGRWAELISATGEAGRVLRESHHRLAIDNRSMVGASIGQKQARIAQDVGAETDRHRNPLLPYTRSEIALPLIVGERVLGSLDVQSTREAAFGEEEIRTLQSVANQVAIALENARLFQETNQRLEELQQAQRQYLRESWSAITSGDKLEYNLGDESLVSRENALNVPLTLRDEIIGEISLNGDAEWSEEERAWIESVATQASIALENARLMEESRKTAGFDRTVAEITTRIWSANTIDGILQTAIKEIGRALNLSEATIELTPGESGAASNE
jgi:GAF domain-containing protein/HAMP domain-containing protein